MKNDQKMLEMRLQFGAQATGAPRISYNTPDRSYKHIAANRLAKLGNPSTYDSSQEGDIVPGLDSQRQCQWHCQYCSSW